MTNPGFEISNDPNRLDFKFIHRFLTNSYWAKARTYTQVKTSIDHSFCFGLYIGGRQIGFARVVTDRAVFAHLIDVFIVPGERGKGYSKRFLEIILDHAELQQVNHWTLKTKDAHRLYEKFGFGL